jgi:hypothetical protein
VRPPVGLATSTCNRQQCFLGHASLALLAAVVVKWYYCSILHLQVSSRFANTIRSTPYYSQVVIRQLGSGCLGAIHRALPASRPRALETATSACYHATTGDSVQCYQARPVFASKMFRLASIYPVFWSIARRPGQARPLGMPCLSSSPAANTASYSLWPLRPRAQWMISGCSGAATNASTGPPPPIVSGQSVLQNALLHDCRNPLLMHVMMSLCANQSGLGGGLLGAVSHQIVTTIPRSW